jgi:hypothetical protein
VLAALTQLGGGRFRGVRNSAGFHPDPVIGNNHHGATAGHYLRKDFQAGLNVLNRMDFGLDALVFHHQHADLLALAQRLPGCQHHYGSLRLAARLRAIRRQRDGGAHRMASTHADYRRVPERYP